MLQRLKGNSLPLSAQVSNKSQQHYANAHKNVGKLAGLCNTFSIFRWSLVFLWHKNKTAAAPKLGLPLHNIKHIKITVSLQSRKKDACSEFNWVIKTAHRFEVPLYFHLLRRIVLENVPWMHQIMEILKLGNISKVEWPLK